MPGAQARRSDHAATLRRPELRDHGSRAGLLYRGSRIQPEAYETAIANLAPELDRRPKPATAEELLDWAGHPLATVEVAALLALDPDEARVALSRVARPLPAGADAYWELSSRTKP